MTKPPLIWIGMIDPETLESYIVTPGSQYELADGVLRIEELGIEVPLRQLEED